jgi:hypothetical protein
MVKVMAAIFRARVRRAMLGRIPILHQGSIEILQRPGAFDGRDGRPLQEIFQIMIMVAVQATHRDALAVTLQLPTHNAVLATVIGLDGKTAVGPKLALATEAMGCLQ